MHLFASSEPVPPVTAEQFAGRWFFSDDGWLGTLTLAADGELALTGTFAAQRFDADFEVTGEVTDPAAHAVHLVIHDYNWMPEQHYTGLLTRGRTMLAGHSEWQGTPFGFFATRSTRQLLGTYRQGNVRGADFAGSWNVHLDGEPATMVLRHDAADGLLHGTYTSRASGGELRVTGRAGGAAPHCVHLTLSTPGGGEVGELSGNLMSRPKNAISGVASSAGTACGFVMIRYE